ncbi:MAG: rod shape-determining protein MreD [Paracoccaceae bacterium]
MAELTNARLWMMRFSFVGLSAAVIFFYLLPLQTAPRSWAGPDMIIALAFAWALRRPEYVPVLSVAVVMLLADLMLQRPPGLLALLVVLGVENLKSRALGLREAPFLAEWSVVALVLIAITLMNRLILGILVVQQAPLGLSILQTVVTLMFYPVVVLLSRFVLGVRKAAPGDARAMGRNI